MGKALHFLILLSLTIPHTSSSSTSTTRFQNSVSMAMAKAKITTDRRIIHHPFDPTGFTPSPPNSPGSASPFFPQIPAPSEPDPDQQNTTTLSPTNSTTTIPPPTSPKSNPINKIMIAGSVSIATLLIVLALVFFVHRYRVRIMVKSVKLACNDPGRLPPVTSNILLLGATRPSNRDLNRSPYHRLNRVHGEEAHHPSPELQPLPLLIGGNQRPAPSVLSSDEETLFYSPQEAIAQNNESSYYDATQQCLPKTTSTTDPRSVICCSNGSGSSCKASPETNNSSSSATLSLSLPCLPPSQFPCPQQSQLRFVQIKTVWTMKENEELSSPSSSDRNSEVPPSINSSPSLEERAPFCHHPPATSTIANSFRENQTSENKFVANENSTII